jgi:hypothetical protein
MLKSDVTRLTVFLGAVFIVTVVSPEVVIVTVVVWAKEAAETAIRAEVRRCLKVFIVVVKIRV